MSSNNNKLYGNWKVPTEPKCPEGISHSIYKMSTEIGTNLTDVSITVNTRTREILTLIDQLGPTHEQHDSAQMRLKYWTTIYRVIQRANQKARWETWDDI